MTTAATLVETGSSKTDDKALAVVLCGSFRREPEALRAVHAELDKRFRLLAPLSVDFTDLSVDFVRLAGEVDEPVSVIEARHLDAMRNSDFVWLFCPGGYVGTSAAIEVGYAHAAGVPVLSDVEPMDEVVAGMVKVVRDLADVSEMLAPCPGQGIAALQDYYRRIARRRGWANESPRDTLLLITEEIGELARAVRKDAGLHRDGSYEHGAVGHELADVQLYLVHLASALGVDLAAAVTEKERVNAERFANRRGAAA